MKESIIALGLMSGTSLDGIDLALCRFEHTNSGWSFLIEAAETVPYSAEWQKKLKEAEKSTAQEILLLHNEYARYTGEVINRFLQGKTMPQLIASHGHTIFHQPKKQFTFQLGNGTIIAAETGIKTIADFRNMDVALGGQGAPLVPIGDRLLFGEYEYCLNLGGFANISYEEEEQRIAFDIGPANIVLNYLAQQKGQEYDKNSLIAKSGQVDNALLNELNNLPFYAEKPPKSLGKEWLDSEMIPLLEKYSLSLANQMRTLYEHVAIQIGRVIHLPGKMLVTGGGAHNPLLMNRIAACSKAEVIIPEKEIIDFKEALIFAFLGVMANRHEINCLSAVTGASRDNTGGTIYLP
ncbi:anhydro-N-acetylmuramic acid kinase [Prolixibacter denitrificans]|uniref:Anhydro-N-acetylmuramic acid kinase n=1 Tax=Prolixibacter denitrificans TaxID=1541063 RepID=A0A2P8CE42_9BACT|nr:anhydro-N-acetylmuramic acid kinase [Prolixibacter denitrificans]PSK83240.1 anhydro-N-acetylmuramic acid kinase [Prolixibacter denitrificans]GET21877.1 anhydro-N-acetylmuramic acid kinase [Prolixibacter denitrificans]